MSLPSWVWVVAAIAVVLLLKRVLGVGRAPLAVVQEKLKAGAVVLDVRSAGEFRGGAYPGARNIPLQELSGRMGELPQNKPIVVYCASGARSGMAARLLARAGRDVVNGGGLVQMPR